MLFKKAAHPYGASLVGQLVKSRLQFNSWVRKIHWRKERLLTTVFWPGEFHELYSLWGRKESDTTDRLTSPTSILVVC